MPIELQPHFLLASGDPVLLQVVEPILLAPGARVSVVLSAQAALAAMIAPSSLSLALFDVRLPGMLPDQLLAAARAEENGCRFPIVLIADTVTDEWVERLRQGVIDDVIPRCCDSQWWRLRIELVNKAFHKAHEVDVLREAIAEHAQFDTLPRAYNRGTLLSLLFRETDRVQRMGTSPCGILFDIDDFGHWNSRLGADACHELLVQVVVRIHRLPRSYDLLGRLGNDEFLAALPGCGPLNAVLLAERIRETFAQPFRVASMAVRLSACFEVASSQGGSPIVLLRELEGALRLAKESGPETIPARHRLPRNAIAARRIPVGYLGRRSSRLVNSLVTSRRAKSIALSAA
jgi:two-component system cell cycle response regulator